MASSGWEGVQHPEWVRVTGRALSSYEDVAWPAAMPSSEECAEQPEGC